MVWALILVIYTNGYYSDSIHTSTVTHYTEREMCDTAGTTAANEAHKNGLGAFYVCVREK